MRLKFSKAKIGLLSTAVLLSIQSAPAKAQTAESPEKLPDLSFLSKPVQPTPLSEEEKVNVGVYKKCSKAVVNIATVTTPEGYYYNIMPQEGIGSGTIISKDGFLVTNEHVVGASEMVRVTLFDGSSYAAKLVGKDPSNDLAVLKIQAPAGKQFDCIEIGN
ncbi:MAG TPA: trypsin-like peptidase domain-containing protein, partial [Candidatus Melainabacteria bacterium]|nr:trypsin-like peptidase domain-containing protein [Candidatus Melainabacteria bacterium]